MGLEATTLAYLAIGSAGVATGVSAYGQYQAGKAADTEAKNQSQILERNAKVADQNAKIADEVARQNARDNRRDANAALATNRAILAEGGGGTGSSLLAAGYTAGQIEKDIATSFVNDLLTSEQWRNEGTNYRLNAKSARISGRMARRASYLSTGATIASGASNMALMGYSMSKPNVDSRYSWKSMMKN